jgi:hypothetical protein
MRVCDAQRTKAAIDPCPRRCTGGPPASSTGSARRVGCSGSSFAPSSLSHRAGTRTPPPPPQHAASSHAAGRQNQQGTVSRTTASVGTTAPWHLSTASCCPPPGCPNVEHAGALHRWGRPLWARLLRQSTDGPQAKPPCAQHNRPTCRPSLRHRAPIPLSSILAAQTTGPAGAAAATSRRRSRTAGAAFPLQTTGASAAPAPAAGHRPQPGPRQQLTHSAASSRQAAV